MNRAAANTILMVDDNKANLDVLKYMLGGRYRLKIATNGRQALSVAFSSEPPDLILLDVMMPDMDGYEVCRLLKADERTRNIPVIFITAKSELEDEAHGFAAGAADHITKPVHASTVLARVATHLSLYDRSRHLESLVTERTRVLLEKTEELEATRVEIIRRLGRAAEFRDNETGMHVIRLGHFVRLIAHAAGRSEAEAEQIMNAAMMHDVGKIGIPDHILLKPGRLTPEEIEVMRRHARIGADIIGDHPSPLLQLARTIALTHHEQWSGNGYPHGLKAEAIPFVGRLTSIADVFDALTSVRPYKQAWSTDDAFDYIVQQRGKAFDPEVVDLFLNVRPEVETVMQTFVDQTITVH